MAILVFQHAPQDNPACLGRVLRDCGHRLRIIELHEGDCLPTDLDDVDGIVSMGGPMNLDQSDVHPWMADQMALLRTAHETSVPVVGVCLGAQLVAAALGGEVGAMPAAENGWHPVQLTAAGTTDPILAGIPWRTSQFHVHGQEVTKLPAEAIGLAGSKLCKHQAFKVGLRTYVFQYHFEWDRADIDCVLETDVAPTGVDIDSIKGESHQHYDLYRRLGDRLANTVTELLFPLDRRLNHTKGPVANYDASQS